MKKYVQFQVHGKYLQWFEITIRTSESPRCSENRRFLLSDKIPFTPGNVLCLQYVLYVQL